MGLSVGELEMINSCPGVIWPNRHEEQCQTVALFSFHVDACTWNKSWYHQECSFVTLPDAMQVQATTSMDRNWNMRAHLYDKEYNARKKFKSTLATFTPPASFFKRSLSTCHERNQVPLAHAKPLLHSILQRLGKWLTPRWCKLYDKQLTWLL